MIECLETKNKVENKIYQKFNRLIIKIINEKIYFFLEYCEGGDFEKFLENNKNLPENKCLEIFQKLNLCFKALDDNEICHRDLKPSNILIKGEIFKIGDFGNN